ncbi:hypothetical protein [Clostridium sp. Marseille-Q7071]
MSLRESLTEANKLNSVDLHCLKIFINSLSLLSVRKNEYLKLFISN